MYRVSILYVVCYMYFISGSLQGVYAKGNTEAPVDVVEQIEDSAIIKILYFDTITSRLSWEDRETFGCGKKVVQEIKGRTLRKSGFNTTPAEDSDIALADHFDRALGIMMVMNGEILDVPEPFEFKSRMRGENGMFVMIDLSNVPRFFELIKCPKDFKTKFIPEAAFKDGTISFNYSTRSLSFSSGTMSLVKGKKYTFNDGKWRVVSE